MYQIELVGGPLDGTQHIIEDPYPPRILVALEPDPPVVATEEELDEVIRYKHAVYTKRPRKGLSVFYDFAGIH